MSSPVKEMTKALAARLGLIPGLTVRDGFPAANLALVMPSLTITVGEPEFMNLQPYEITRTAPNVGNQTTVKRVVGQYDFRLQLDLWARSTTERDAFFELIFAKLNPDVEPMGLRLKLTAYHDEWVAFSLDKHQIVDDEAGAQRQEWRMRFDLLATCKAILSKDEFAMIDIENLLSTPDTI